VRAVDVVLRHLNRAFSKLASVLEALQIGIVSLSGEGLAFSITRVAHTLIDLADPTALDLSPILLRRVGKHID